FVSCATAGRARSHSKIARFFIGASKGPRLRRSGRPRTSRKKKGQTAAAPPEVRPAAARVGSTTGRARSSPLSPLPVETDFLPALDLHHARVLDDDLDRAVADLGEREP